MASARASKITASSSSVPAMRECSYWDLLDDFTWNFCEGGLITADRRPKKAYHALKKLFHEEWKTSLETITDADGCVAFRGFHGDYSVDVDGYEKATVQLTADRDASKKVLSLSANTLAV